jgi:hypothetical protein
MSRNHPIQDSEQRILNQSFDSTKKAVVTATVSTDGTRELFEVSKLVAKKNTSVTAGSLSTHYIAIAPIGTADATAGWQVKKIVVDSSVAGTSTMRTTWAEKDGVPTADFVHVATDLTALTYS